ncbi:ABC transporter permease [Acidobacterium sp. S8]|uniref:ABC transporter permease n=1 Tax=Acidobacterium sp. S8 TaxID=1641854 RepID=UPI00131C715E|nr:ABC transporter permease [Acidobacterium sp. S8]
MKRLFHKALAFIKRDFAIESGYQAAFIMGLVESIMLLVIFHFIGQLLAPKSSGSLSRYGSRYFPFALVGVAFARYFDLMLRMFSESIRQAQVTGCLEAMLCSQTGCVTIVLMSSLYSLITGAVQLILILLGGVVLFGVDLSHMNISATLLVLFISVAIFVAFGVLSASAIVWLKKGDPITWVLGGFGSILGGAYFPVDVMPVWMQKLSFLVPITYSLDALRLTILRGDSIASVARPIMTLTVLAVILLPASAAIFAAAVRNGRKEGTLMQY